MYICIIILHKYINKYTITMQTTNDIAKKPVAPTLRNMSIGDSSCFPIRQLSSMTTSIARVSKEMKKKFSYSTDENTICVTRIK